MLAFLSSEPASAYLTPTHSSINHLAENRYKMKHRLRAKSVPSVGTVRTQHYPDDVAVVSSLVFSAAVGSLACRNL